jgi:hypothetical protein
MQPNPAQTSWSAILAAPIGATGCSHGCSAVCRQADGAQLVESSPSKASRSGRGEGIVRRTGTRRTLPLPLRGRNARCDSFPRVVLRPKRAALHPWLQLNGTRIRITALAKRADGVTCSAEWSCNRSTTDGASCIAAPDDRADCQPGEPTRLSGTHHTVRRLRLSPSSRE